MIPKTTSYTPPLHLPVKNLAFSPFSKIKDFRPVNFNIDKEMAMGTGLFSLSFLCFVGGMAVLKGKLK